jgi:hypothetical protein
MPQDRNDQLALLKRGDKDVSDCILQKFPTEFIRIYSQAFLKTKYRLKSKNWIFDIDIKGQQDYTTFMISAEMIKSYAHLTATVQMIFLKIHKFLVLKYRFIVTIT